MTFDEWIDDNMDSLHESTILGDLRRAFNAGMMADVHADNSKVIENLKKENAELKENNKFLNNLVKEKEQRGLEIQEDLLKENAELKEKSKRQSNNYGHDVSMLIADNKYRHKVYKELAHEANILQDQLTKAKMIIGNLYAICKDNHYPDSSVLMEQAEQFLKDLEK